MRIVWVNELGGYGERRSGAIPMENGIVEKS
jgi:hypothetical protein